VVQSPLINLFIRFLNKEREYLFLGAHHSATYGLYLKAKTGFKSENGLYYYYYYYYYI